MFKGLANLASLMRQAQQMSGKMQALNEQLKNERTSATAGGGMVEVQVNGLGEVLRVKIDPLLVERGEREMIEDLIPAAVNQAVVKARQLHMDAMKSITEGFDMPGLNDALAQLTGGGPGGKPEG
jgi:DNA-binding YbaB/EbfC family protein